MPAAAPGPVDPAGTRVERIVVEDFRARGDSASPGNRCCTSRSWLRSADVVIVGASLVGRGGGQALVDAGLETVDPRAQGAAAPQDLQRHPVAARASFPARELRPAAARGAARADLLPRRDLPFPEHGVDGMDFFGGTTPHLHRKYLRPLGDQAQRRRSRTISTSFAGLQDKGDHVIVHARRERCAVVVPRAPGHRRGRPELARDPLGLSPITRSRSRGFSSGRNSTTSSTARSTPDYFHFWFHPGLGHYTWSHARDGHQIVGVGFKRGDKFDAKARERDALPAREARREASRAHRRTKAAPRISGPR